MSVSVDDYEWPAFQGRKPFDHQKTTVHFELKYKRGYILNDMGTGKTLAGLWGCDMLLWAQKIRRVLIISPLSTMKSVWYNEIMMNIPHRQCAIAHGNPSIRRAVLTNPAYTFVIMNHDGIKSEEDTIVDQQFDVIIIDELTAYKSHSSDRSKCMKRIADKQYADMNRARQRDGAVWGMTGDATPNSPLEAYMQCKIVNPRNQYLPKYFGQFKDACMTVLSEYVEIAKPEAPQIVAMCMQPSIRFTRDQCLDLPDTMYQEMDIELTPEQKVAYAQMTKDLVLLDEEKGIEVTAQSAAIKLNKLLQISAGAVKDDTGDVVEIGCKPRMDALFDILDETPQHKLVVFATYRATIHMLVKEAEKRKVKAAAIYGDVPQNKREAHISNFQQGDLELLILQPQSAAHGITLTAASTIVWFSLVPSNEHFNQGNARIVRAGQTRKTQIIMFASTKAEKHIAGILRRKGDMSKEILRLFTDRDF